LKGGEKEEWNGGKQEESKGKRMCTKGVKGAECRGDEK
jgi:hypothetical protein